MTLANNGSSGRLKLSPLLWTSVARATSIFSGACGSIALLQSLICFWGDLLRPLTKSLEGLLEPIVKTEASPEVEVVLRLLPHAEGSPSDGLFLDGVAVDTDISWSTWPTLATATLELEVLLLLLLPAKLFNVISCAVKVETEENES